MSTNSGWSNYETWCVNMWYGDQLAKLADDGNFFTAVEDLKEEILGTQGNLPTTGLVADFLSVAFSRVNWDEIFNHYVNQNDLAV